MKIVDNVWPSFHFVRKEVQILTLSQELHDRLVKPLPAGSRLVTVLDTCHSGSLLGSFFCRPGSHPIVDDKDEDEPDGVKADVISLASCKDSQISWEEGRKSMTSVGVYVFFPQVSRLRLCSRLSSSYGRTQTGLCGRSSQGLGRLASSLSMFCCSCICYAATRRTRWR